MSRQLWTLLDVACPFCGAGQDEKCRRRTTGRLIPEFHEARRLAFRIARIGQPSAR